MSDTPRTDELAQKWDSGRLMPSDLLAATRELERENAALRAQDAWLIATFSNREDENQKLRAELEAQAVVNGKGGEREAKLLAEVAALRKAKDMLEVERCECLRTMDLALNESAGLRVELEESQQYGRNHAYANMKLLSVISRIRRAVDEQPKKSQAMRLKDVGNLCGEVLGKEFRNESHFGVYPA